MPGPACYGTGGTEPTVTDADLVLGRLGTRTLLGGGMTLDREAAERAIHDRVAAPLGLGVAEAAEGIVRVINATMTAAIRKLTIERGHDPRRFALCPFGGAGPMHGAELAAELGVAETVIPIAPGVHSALGLLMTNLREDRTRTLVRRLDAAAREELRAVLGDLETEGRAQLRAHDGVAPAVSRAVGQRYLGQRYELSVPVGAELPPLAELGDRFHALHDQRYGYRRDDHPVEVASAWVAVEHDLHPLELPTLPAADGEPRAAPHAGGSLRRRRAGGAGVRPRRPWSGLRPVRTGRHRAARRHLVRSAGSPAGGGPLRPLGGITHRWLTQPRSTP